MPVRRCLAASLLAIAVSTLGFAAEDDYVWVEGEDAANSSVSPHPWYSNMVNKSLLSGGGWISQFTDKADGTASYQVTIPKDIREALDIRDGDAVEFWIRGDELRVERIKRVEELRGSFKTPEHLKDMTWKEIRRHAIDTHVAEKAAKWKRQELAEKQERGE
jgi:AbrB family looped-hinge helix DNA binding protein